MNVKELIEALNKLPEDAEVCISYKIHVDNHEEEIMKYLENLSVETWSETTVVYLQGFY